MTSRRIAKPADRFFSEFDYQILHSQRATAIVDDGRTVIAAAPGRFDLVLGDLVLPWAPGEARLYSVEHFRAVRRSLRAEGVFCQWLAMYQLTPHPTIGCTTFFSGRLESQRADAFCHVVESEPGFHSEEAACPRTGRLQAVLGA